MELLRFLFMNYQDRFLTPRTLLCQDSYQNITKRDAKRLSREFPHTTNLVLSKCTIQLMETQFITQAGEDTLFMDHLTWKKIIGCLGISKLFLLKITTIKDRAWFLILPILEAKWLTFMLSITMKRTPHVLRDDRTALFIPWLLGRWDEGDDVWIRSYMLRNLLMHFISQDTYGC